MAHWQFRPLNPNETSGSSISDDNFADEERTSVEILVRETLQNPLDARAGEGVVHVQYRLVTVDLEASSFVRSIFSDNWLAHFRAGDLIEGAERPKTMTFLLVEDFGTTGLEGCYTDSSREGSTENWNAFWFREGEGAKTTKSNGGAGQGKITLYLASHLRSVFALTRRRSDGKDLLFGCCRFKRNYKLPGDDNRWAKEARWGATSDYTQLAVPITDDSIIAGFKSELGLRKTSDPGTTFVVPMPTDEMTETSLRNAVVNEFYFAISRGRLVVDVGDTRIEAASIAGVADQMGAAFRLSKRYREFLELAARNIDGPATSSVRPGWDKESALAVARFDQMELTELKEKFSKSEIVSVDFPVTVKRRPREDVAATFRVFLQLDESAEQSQELFVRQDLGIDGEKRLKAIRTLVPVMALTFVQDAHLSDFLVAAEEPTHRNWNARRPKLVAQYRSPNDLLNAVRNAALRLVKLISPEGSRDETALAMYFADPASELVKRQGGDGTTEAPHGDPRPPLDIPKPRPKPVSIRAKADGFEVIARPVESVVFPLECEVTLAYATVVGDPFKSWDAADFWVADTQSYPREEVGISEVSTNLNRLKFRLETETSSLSMSGFAQDRQLQLRVKYKEVSDGTDHEDN
ncbi:hypothetical protein [Luteimonas sp. YGD11-2]|uniref:hypothetical protein n=1 Tax=Luteimonas sp. YGD11-2 TaxID=2508168 RepID=UPI00100A4280|nr:hypothetical protein [Luteimonas sp. YGD11-2]